jgi:DNA sulfur modification protein DndE
MAIVAAIAFTSLISVASCRKAKAEADGTLSADDVDSIALDAYVYGYPLITMDQTRRVMTNVATAGSKHAPMGQFANMPSYPDASFHEVTAPNANTLYSMAWLDLTAEPYVLSLPDEHGRYYLMPMLDAWTNVFESPGARTTGTDAQRYVIAGPNWNGSSTIPNAKVIKAPTNLVWIIGRTFAQQTVDDLNAVHQLQRQYTLVPLSAFGSAYTPPAGPVDPGVDMKTGVREQVNQLDAATFFNRLAMLTSVNPPAPADSAIVSRMASIGIVAGQAFDASKFGPDASTILQTVPRRGLQRILAFGKSVPTVNGWQYATNLGSYGTKYDLRAYVAYAGLGANLPQDAIYPATAVDGSGQALDGSRDYVLHFAKGQEPPVKGFWSVTMYDQNPFTGGSCPLAKCST